MDDDPEPTVDQMILESHEANEQLLSFREPKCATEISEESTLESGDIGPFVDPESPKKPMNVKDLPVQTDSKTSIFRRKEWMDQSQQVDLPDSVKSSSTSLRKVSRRNSQRLVGQDSRRSSQQTSSQLPVLSQKSSRGQVANEADMKDSSWVSLRTGKVMTCRSQQTSQIWERKALSEILHPSSDESVPSKDEDSEFITAEDDLTSSGETANERYPRHESRQGSKQLEGKISKHSSQQRFERFGSRRSSQRSSELPYALGPKYSRVRASTTGTDTDEDVTWISQKTGREMKCKAQQTSQIWGPRVHSGIFSSSRRESQVSREEELGFTTTDEVTSSGETGREESTVDESPYSSQREGCISKLPSWQQFGRPEAHRRSQQTTEQPSLLHLKSSRDELTEERTSEEKPSSISQRSGKDVKCQSQQTSLVWEQKILSEIMTVQDKASDVTIVGEEDTEHQTQQAEEQKPELLRKKHKSKIDQALQTDSCESIKKELADSSQQTDISEGVKMSLVDLRQAPSRGSRRSSKELTRQYSSSGSPKHRDSRRSSQQSLQSKTKTAEEEDDLKGPSDIESKPPTLDQKASEETIWVSQKTGRVVKNESQQTDRSWLQYLALKSQKLKRSISQQTDESFLQWYKSNKLKQVCREHRRNHMEPDMRRCTVCGDMYGEDFTIDLDSLPSFSTSSFLSTISSEETTEAESPEGREEQPQPQQHLQQDSEGGSQEVGGEETPKAVDQESQEGRLKMEDDQTFAQPADKLEDKSASESLLLYTEGEDKIQQTYSMISFEDGIWLNRKTGKLLVTHSQQTSETEVRKFSKTALEESGSAKEDSLAPGETEENSRGVNQDVQQEMEVSGQQPSGQGSRRGSWQAPNSEFPLLPGQPAEEVLQNADEIEKLVCSRLSEATLLSIESPDMDDGPVQIYNIVSLEKGSWINVKTGKLLASQSQQTEAPPAEDEASVKAPSQRPPEEGQVDTL